MQVKKRAILGQLSDMDLRLLRVFKVVVDCGGMSAAELELNISLSTISKHIKDLEQRLGLTLCHRGREGFAVTDEGLLIYQETINLLAATEAFRRGVDDVHQRLGGQLHVAIFDHTVSNPQAHIGRAIALFSEQAPEVSLQMYVEPINTIERGVIDGQFQIGIIPMHRSAESLSYSSLFSERMFLYCGAQHELFSVDHEMLNWDLLHHYAFAGLGYHSPNMELSLQQHLQRKATGFAQESIATLILSGKYVGFLPDHYAAFFVAQNMMRAIKPALFRYHCEYSSVLRRSPSPQRVVKLFHECLLATHGTA
ncbi:LysR family transcriptional regulator [Serratia quinivorans]|uniref:LysR family transcriptional regulator n=1 Tax=Serratia quinivorans TaxID=137545 RepID=UPI000D90BC8D|nr:LysR family transcriptional regulator [Serratia quinivorans]SPZ61808.1 Cat operon transcriptional regulator [Serratia quinivorans]VEI64163.1 Cat operon transcriptional regulator [Serratia quinivorans]